jgi:hypothetical protein
MNIVEWRWSTGEEYLKSPRKLYGRERTRGTELESELEVETENNKYNNSIETSFLQSVPDNTEQAIHQSLNGYQNEITSFDSFGFDTTFSRSENESGNRREDLDNKISDRELFFQRGTNPFLQTSNYVDNVVKQDMFLKPRNTTSEKVKQDENT